MTLNTSPNSVDLRRFAFIQGPGKTIVTEPMVVAPVARQTDAIPPIPFTDGAGRPLPTGTVDYLDGTIFPEPLPYHEVPAGQEALLRALVTAFGLQRREPSNQYNDHRGYPSVRSKFPVCAFLIQDGCGWFIDVYRHALVPVRSVGSLVGPPRIVLAGRWTALPSFYERLRGPLVDLELGINLRILSAALSMWGIKHAVRTPDTTVAGLLEVLGLDPAEWALPIVVELDPDPRRIAPAQASTIPDSWPDPTSPEIHEINRRVLQTPLTSLGSMGIWGLGTGSSDRTWARVLWERSSGRMPRQLSGMDARPAHLSPAALETALGWFQAPVPTESMRRVSPLVRTLVALAEIPGRHPAGVYEASTDGLRLVRADPQIMQQLEDAYGLSLAVANGTAIRHATAVWFFTVSVPDLISACGDGAWTLVQYWAGWQVQGLALAAAAHGMWSRPSRAFEDISLQPVLGVPAGSTTVLSLLCGVSRYHEPMLDLRA